MKENQNLFTFYKGPEEKYIHKEGILACREGLGVLSSLNSLNLSFAELW